MSGHHNGLDGQVGQSLGTQSNQNCTHGVLEFSWPISHAVALQMQCFLPQVSLFFILPPALKDVKFAWEETERGGKKVRKAEVIRRRNAGGKQAVTDGGRRSP